MKRSEYPCLAIAGLLFAVLALASPAPDLDSIAGRVDRHYNQLHSLSADFEESYTSPGISRNEAGKLWLKKPGKMRWEYRQPREKLFVSDGKAAYFYVSGEQQASKAEVKNLDDLRSPLRYLLGKTRLKKEFENLRLDAAAPKASEDDVVLRGTPKKMRQRVADVALEINPSDQIVGITIQETDGSTTEFRFHDIVENVPVDDRQFRFVPPAGVEVIASPELAP
jgi:outer membrane lipoprotein carrier protein